MSVKLVIAFLVAAFVAQIIGILLGSFGTAAVLGVAFGYFLGGAPSQRRGEPSRS